MHDLILDQRLETMQDLNKKLDCLLLCEFFSLFQKLRHISFVAILQDEVKVVGGFFEVV
jgi:hypothetical protein